MYFKYKMINLYLNIFLNMGRIFMFEMKEYQF